MMKSKVRLLFYVSIANFLIAIANVYFIIPYGIFSGGLTGMAMLFQPIIPFSLVLWVNIISLILVILTYIYLEKEIFIQTLLSAIIYAIFLNFIKPIGFFSTPSLNPILASVIAGIFFGIGVTICLKVGSSSVSVDTIALIIVSRFPKYDLKKVLRFVSIFLILLGFLVKGAISVFLGLVYTIVYNVVFDKLIERG